VDHWIKSLIPISIHPEDDGGIVLRNDVTSHSTTRHHNPEDLDLNLHCRESLKSRIINMFTNGNNGIRTYMVGILGNLKILIAF
jgi:hypothetical protein